MKHVWMLGLALGCGSHHEQASAPAAPMAVPAGSPEAAIDSPRGVPAPPAGARLEPVAMFDGSMPTGVAVSREGRVFVNFPRWGDPVPFTVAEIKDGKPVAYPDEPMNALPPGDQASVDGAKRFVSVQSVVVDPANRLWVLDTGSVEITVRSSSGSTSRRTRW